jgi:DNA repair exonuclease SbcCD ATPase subunit
LANYEATIIQRHDELEDNITELQNKTHSAISEYEEKSKEILGQIDSSYSQMLANASRQVEEFNREMQSVSENSKSEQSKFIMRIQNDANEMQARMSDLTNELIKVESTIQSYEKADMMRKQLETNIQTLNAEFAKIGEYSKTVSVLNNQFANVSKMNDELRSHINSLEAQKGRVISLEQEYGKMISFSNTIAERQKTLSTTADDLQAMEVTVKNYTERLEYISQQFEMLNRKDETLERIKKDVNNSYEHLTEIEKRIADCNRQVVSMPNEIKDVQNNIDRLLKNIPKVSDAIAKLDKLDDIMSTTEERIASLTSAQSGIKTAEIDLQNLRRDVNEKFGVLRKITQSELTQKPLPSNSGINPSDIEMIKTLKREGWRNEEIAKRFNRTLGEIELALAMPSDE